MSQSFLRKEADDRSEKPVHSCSATYDGDLLHDHVRVEERELFERIECIVPAAELEA